jgi:predicted Zn-dependent peptidase
MAHYLKKVLPNGMRVVLVPLKDTETITVMILAETGSEYEEKAQNGISHFLEHMCFKGTIKRPHFKDISHELDNLGSSYNAFTSSDHTGYYAKAHWSKTSNLLDIISDIYLHSTFPEEEIEREKGVVIEEINMYEDRPQSKVWEVFSEAVFGDQPAGRTILGTKETVSAITRDDLIAYHKKYYVPEATTLVISGRMDEKKITKEVEEIFSSVEQGTKILKPKVIDEQSKPEVKIHFKESDQTHFVIGFRSRISRYDDNDKVYPAGLLGSILGSGMSSRLFERVREQLGLAYYVSASHSTEMDYGMFTINAGVSNKNAVKAVEAIFEELRRIKNELVPAEELERVKERRKGHIFLALETSDEWADFYGFPEMYHDEILSPEEVIERREKVTSEDVKRMANDIFRPENLTIALIGPHKDVQKFYDTIAL